LPPVEHWQEPDWLNGKVRGPLAVQDARGKLSDLRRFVTRGEHDAANHPESDVRLEKPVHRYRRGLGDQPRDLELRKRASRHFLDVVDIEDQSVSGKALDGAEHLGNREVGDERDRHTSRNRLMRMTEIRDHCRRRSSQEYADLAGVRMELEREAKGIEQDVGNLNGGRSAVLIAVGQIGGPRGLDHQRYSGKQLVAILEDEVTDRGRGRNYQIRASCTVPGTEIVP
jgi:hypothetical protein